MSIGVRTEVRVSTYMPRTRIQDRRPFRVSYVKLIWCDSHNRSCCQPIHEFSILDSKGWVQSLEQTSPTIFIMHGFNLIHVLSALPSKEILNTFPPKRRRRDLGPRKTSERMEEKTVDDERSLIQKKSDSDPRNGHTRYESHCSGKSSNSNRGVNSNFGI